MGDGGIHRHSSDQRWIRRVGRMEFRKKQMSKFSQPSPWFSAEVKRKREEARIPKLVCAKKINADRNTFAAFEAGKTELSFSQSLRLMDFLNINFNQVASEVMSGH